MEQPILYASRPLTFSAADPIWLPGTLVTDDQSGELRVKTLAGHWLEIHGDGAQAEATDAGALSLCRLGTFNVLLYTPYADRPGTHATYGVAFREQ